MKNYFKLSFIGIVVMSLLNSAEVCSVSNGLSNGLCSKLHWFETRKVRDVIEITTERELRGFLNRLGPEIMNLEGEFTRTRMNQYLGEEVDWDLLIRKSRDIYFNEAYYKIISDWLVKTEDSILKRRLKILKLWFDFQRVSLSPEISKLEKQLIEESQDVNIEAKFKKLVKLRNEKSQELGYRDWVDLKFQLNEIDEKWLQEIFAQLKKATDEPMQILADRETERFGEEKIQPWARHFWFWDIMEKYVDRIPLEVEEAGVWSMLNDMGIERNDLPIEVRQAEEFPFVAYSFCIRRGLNGENIIILNKKRLTSFQGTVAHEIGHSVSNSYALSDLSIELQGIEGVNSAYSEGMAEIFRFIVFNKEWLTKYTDLSPQEVKELSNALYWSWMYATRRRLARAEFEYEVYKNPEQDLNKVWEDIQRKYGRDRIEISLSWTVFLSYLVPSEVSIYFQNYILGDLVAAQVMARLEQRYATFFDNSKIGPFFIEKLYSPGISRPWREIIKGATGKDLDVEAFIKEVIRNLIP